MGPLEGPPSTVEGQGSSSAPGQHYPLPQDLGAALHENSPSNLPPSQRPPPNDQWSMSPQDVSIRDQSLAAPRPSDQDPGASYDNLAIPPGADQQQQPQSPSRPRGNGSRKASSSRICGKCGQPLTGQFVRALGDTYHLECFTCFDCNKIVASKFFPVPESGPNQVPLCETDYFRRLDLLCFQCGGALRGSYITALDRKYHIEHFTCSVCPTVFGASDSYYEHESNVFCHYHYSTQFAQRCNGCQTAILKQFVEIFRNGQNQHWHPECYMIHKYWNVRLSSSQEPLQPLKEPTETPEDASIEVREHIRKEEERIERKVNWIWRTLSTFEEKSATCISDMLLHVSNAAIMEGILSAKKFIVYVELLFGVADDLDKMLKTQSPKGLTYNREARLLCKKLVAFFDLLLHAQLNGVRRLGVTQELLSLVTGLAHYLKLMIRINLQGALRYDRAKPSEDIGLNHFLDQVNSLDQRLEDDAKVEVSSEIALYSPKEADTCPICQKAVEGSGFQKGNRVFHDTCMLCQSCGRDTSQRIEDARWTEQRSNAIFCKTCQPGISDDPPFSKVNPLQYYVHLLRVAHARLLANLQRSHALPHTSDSPNLTGYDSSQGHRIKEGNAEAEPQMLTPDARSKSYGAGDGQHEASYKQTLGDIRRLRSTRMDKHLSTSMRRARSSRVIDGPDGIRPGSAGDEQGQHRDLTIVQDDDDGMGEGGSGMMLGADSLALDDIPRIVAREQARDHRPNASRYAGGHLIGDEPQPRLLNGHRREFSDGAEMLPIDSQTGRSKMYFSELSPLKYFIVRHIAVLSMEPLLEGQFNQEELLALIETRKAQAWWKFPKAFKKNKKDKDKDSAVFQKSLDLVVERDGAESTDGVGPGTLRIPSIVQDAVSAMKTMDMSVEGVFRKNGNIKRLKELAEEIDTKGIDAVDLTKESPVQVAALLKKYLRDLPDPVLTLKLHRLWIAAAKIENEDERKRLLHLICCLLPKVNRDTMEVLFAFLNWVSSFHTVDEETGSKMDIHNLATVIAPNILYSTSKANMDSSFLAIEAVHTMLRWNEELCTVPDEIVSLLNDPLVFGKDADITTKEILKRWGEIKLVPQVNVASAMTMPSKTIEGRPAAPVITRVDSDNTTWQNEVSVRHVGGPGGPGGAGGAGGPGGPGVAGGGQPPAPFGQPNPHNTPPQNYNELSTPNLPYAHGHNNGSSESYGANGSPHRHSQFRSNSGYQAGALGITGTG